MVEAVEGGRHEERVADHHIWSIGPELYAGALAVVSHRPREPEVYKRKPQGIGLVHATVEVHRCPVDIGDPVTP